VLPQNLAVFYSYKSLSSVLTETDLYSDEEYLTEFRTKCSPAGNNLWHVLVINSNGEANEEFDAIYDEMTRYVTIKRTPEALTNSKMNYRLIIEEIPLNTE